MIQENVHGAACFWIRARCHSGFGIKTVFGGGSVALEALRQGRIYGKDSVSARLEAWKDRESAWELPQTNGML